jgi:PPK2 family polyphosphate:nucleotide phosphotransferase
MSSPAPSSGNGAETNTEGEAQPGAQTAVQKALDRIDCPWRVDAATALSRPLRQYLPPADAPDEDQFRIRLEEVRAELQPLQKKLIASKQFSILLVFQALDAAGKDGAIREVLSGLDVGGIRVASFKRPSTTELMHDFMWRTTRELPERGQIGAFNRSYYEEVLTVRVHPEFLDAQYAGNPPPAELLWPARYRAIREFEKHLAMSNTLVLKFWLNVSPERQAMRFLDRLEDDKRLWKFSSSDIVESGHREAYDEAVRRMFSETSLPCAPWFCVPADQRWYLRWQITEILLQALRHLPLEFPDPEQMDRAARDELRQSLRQKAGIGPA